MSKLKHITVNEEVYQKLKNLDKAGDSFNDVLVRILEKKIQLLESDSRVGAREKTLTNSLPSVFKGDDKP
ncbi:MAG TPA: antitoxin VapB family protein [Nitrososphaeraceae archaeon]|nr:antitoxin VapB family protein [Nitrososphaeraceae archaeon]